MEKKLFFSSLIVFAVLDVRVPFNRKAPVITQICEHYVLQLSPVLRDLLHFGVQPLQTISSCFLLLK